jgi:tRNA (Thr-GGU) A37 N-methylase
MEGFSHVWLIFGFHETEEKGYTPTVRPPRLGGNERVGVFASRSTFRPNGLGLSLCRMEGVERKKGKMLLHLGGIDLIDGTPVYDIKPYLAYAESISDASCGYAADAPVRKDVQISSECARSFAKMSSRDQSIVRETLALDPRPAAHEESDRIYGAHLCGVNVRFRVGKVVEVLEILTKQEDV